MTPTTSPKTWELLLRRLDSVDEQMREIKGMLKHSEDKSIERIDSLRSDLGHLHEKANSNTGRIEAIRALRLGERVNKLEDKTSGMSAAGELLKFSIPVVISILVAAFTFLRLF